MQDCTHPIKSVSECKALGQTACVWLTLDPELKKEQNCLGYDFFQFKLWSCFHPNCIQNKSWWVLFFYCFTIFCLLFHYSLYLKHFLLKTIFRFFFFFFSHFGPISQQPQFADPLMTSTARCLPRRVGSELKQKPTDQLVLEVFRETFRWIVSYLFFCTIMCRCVFDQPMSSHYLTRFLLL